MDPVILSFYYFPPVLIHILVMSPPSGRLCSSNQISSILPFCLVLDEAVCCNDGE